MRNLEEILNRVKEKLNLKSDSDLAKYLDLSSGTIPNWRIRNKIPYEELFTICEKNNFDIQYIFYGNTKNISEIEDIFYKLTDDEKRMYLAEMKLRVLERKL